MPKTLLLSVHDLQNQGEFPGIESLLVTGFCYQLELRQAFGSSSKGDEKSVSVPARRWCTAITSECLGLLLDMAHRQTPWAAGFSSTAMENYEIRNCESRNQQLPIRISGFFLTLKELGTFFTFFIFGFFLEMFPDCSWTPLTNPGTDHVLTTLAMCLRCGTTRGRLNTMRQDPNTVLLCLYLS